MQAIAFYGKGGIGKSTLAAGVSLTLAKAGRRVLHVGCDPKHDSSLLLLEGGSATTVLEQVFTRPSGSIRFDDVRMPGKFGIDCIESGGPEPGVGCGGRAVSKMFELLEGFGIFRQGLYDLVVFDVLGDVVCGGFAAPLRKGISPKVVVVTSEELMSVYAANNISKAVKAYRQNGVALAGVVVNRRDNLSDLSGLEAFAAKLSSRILAVIDRDPLIQEAEANVQHIVEADPEAPSARQIGVLANLLVAVEASDCAIPTPLTLEDLRGLERGCRAVR